MSTSIVVAFIPGTTASQLNSTLLGNVWPTVLDPSLSLTRQALLATAMETQQLQVGNLVSSYPTNPPLSCYADLMAYFGTANNFQDSQGFSLFTYNTSVANNKTPIPAANKLFYMIPYDWRNDNADNAAWVNNALNYLDAQYTAKGNSYQLYLLAHSMGGLISRFLLESSVVAKPPAKAVTPGAWLKKTQSLITLATPHLGAPLAWSAIAGQEISPIEPSAGVIFIKTVVNSASHPSTFELLPPPQVSFMTDTSGSALSIYNPSANLQAAIKQFNINTGNITTASAFFSGLSYTKNPTSIPYYFYYGYGLDTLANPTVGSTTPGAFVLNPNSNGTSADVFALSCTGDGVVPYQSAICNGISTSNVNLSGFVYYNHGEMGGSDMTNHPNSILAAAKQMGLNPTGSPKATPPRSDVEPK